MRKKLMTLFMAAMLAVTTICLSACGGNSDQETTKAAEGDNQETESIANADDSTGSTTYPLTITDDLGNEVTIESEPERVVSLSPSCTEILFAVGAGDRVKGRTDYCSYPEEAAAVDSIGTYSSPNTELIISMEPDVIFAADYIDDSIRSQVEAAGAKVVVFSATTIEAVEKDIQLAGQVLNLNEESQAIVDGMEADLKEIQETLPANTETKSVFVDIGSFYSAGPGSLYDDVLNQIGVTNIAADSGETWPQLSVEVIIEKNPDIYISTYTTPDELKAISGLNELDCIKNDQIVYFDGYSAEADMIQRPGPRIVEGVRVLAESIYPELFQ